MYKSKCNLMNNKEKLKLNIIVKCWIKKQQRQLKIKVISILSKKKKISYQELKDKEQLREFRESKNIRRNRFCKR